MLWSRAIVALSVGCAVAVCGCGSSKRRPGTTAAPSTSADVTSSPALVASNPPNGATRVARDVIPSVTFSTALRPELVPFGIRLLTAAEVEVRGTPRLLGPNTVGFEPLGLLDGGTSYVLRASPELVSDAGVPVQGAVEVHFQTQPSLAPGSILINEVYAGTDDSNGLQPQDDFLHDEQFVELVNVTNQPLDLAGLRIATTAEPQAHVFGSLVLSPGAAAVVWAQSPGGPGNVQASDRRGLQLDSTSYFLQLLSDGPVGPVVIDELVFPQAAGAGPLPSGGESLNRIVDAGVGDVRGGRFVRHPAAPGAAGPFSPGAHVNGSPYVAPDAR